MSTTRPHPAGDCGPEPEGAATEAAPDAGDASGGTSGDTPAGATGSSAAAAAAPRDTAPRAAAAKDAAALDTAALDTAALDTEKEGAVPGVTQSVRQVRRLRLAGAGGAVPSARDFTRQALHDWGWLPAATGDQRAAAEDVLLVVSELVTNACLHADGPEELRLGAGPKVLRLEIVDLGTGAPSPRTPHRAGRPGGHGMFIVQRLCLDWGVVRNPEGTGKTVWAELAAPS